MSKLPTVTYSEQLQDIVRDYRAEKNPWPATSRQIAGWALHTGRWAPSPATLVKQCAEDIARAMREEYFVDPQGRSVRTKHAARVQRDGQQLVLWEDIRTGSPMHMQIAFQQRRQQIVGDCRQLKTDVDSYNENSNPSGPIQMIFDFTDDLKELEILEAV